MKPSVDTDPSVRLERVRGQIDEVTAASLRAFWQAHDVLGEGRAEIRLPRVLSRLVDEEGRTVGSSSATPERVPAIAGQWFQVYRCLIAEPYDTPDHWMDMLAAGWDIVSAESGRDLQAPCIGMLALVADENIGRAWPQAIWPRTHFLHAGVARNGAALRVRYFEDARIDLEAGHG